MENAPAKENIFKRAWNGGTLTRVLLIVICVVLAAAVIFCGYKFVKLFDVGEDVLKGSWQYKAKVTTAGDLDCVFHFAEDGAVYIESEYATNSGTYSIVKGGQEGTFITTIVGEEIMYDYVLDGDTLNLTSIDGLTMILTRIH